MKYSRKLKDIYNRNFFQSVNTALEGVVHTLQSERNMRIHFLSGFLVLIAGIYFNFSSVEFLLLCFAVSFVLVSEMFNTAVERMVDMMTGEYDQRVKIIKDIAAGAVFVSAVNAFIVGYILLFRRITSHVGVAFNVIKQSPWHVTLIALLIVVGIVLFIKVMRKERSLLRGGMPSGHSALAFSIWMIVSLLTWNGLVSILVFLMALVVARSRVSVGVHSPAEVVAGSVLGALITLLIFQLFSLGGSGYL
ncbi:MAG: diacylglycerol kinase [Candidatus Omnitrophica bacterium]|nr:diacylglycerol kinase [Candidatus Omnitrophota bacterium]MDD5488087.1 diacylglycerol kinase [Candidatus Omnitrophota bacterium]